MWSNTWPESEDVFTIRIPEWLGWPHKRYGIGLVRLVMRWNMVVRWRRRGPNIIVAGGNLKV
jgi:hypothetical protein